eukprot:189233-Pelagomonas_calceolata.AAC.8
MHAAFWLAQPLIPLILQTEVLIQTQEHTFFSRLPCDLYGTMHTCTWQPDLHASSHTEGDMKHPPCPHLCEWPDQHDVPLRQVQDVFQVKAAQARQALQHILYRKERSKTGFTSGPATGPLPPERKQAVGD